MSLSLFGFGCQKITPNDLPVPELNKGPISCAEKKTQAEKLINEFTLQADLQPMFKAWRKAFMEVNQVDEKYFNEHVFLVGFDQDEYTSNPYPEKFNYNKYTLYEFDYYFKFNDFYVYVDHNNSDDEVVIKSGLLSSFLKDDIDLKRSKESNIVSGSSEVERKFVSKEFAWGAILVDKIRINNTLPEPITCDNAVKLFATCDKDIVPDLSMDYHSSSNLVTFRGFTDRKIIKNRQFCTSVEVDMVNNKILKCDKQTVCLPM